MYKISYTFICRMLVFQKKQAIRGDSSCSLRIDQIRTETLDRIKRFKSDKTNYDNNSHNDAITRTRAGGAVVPANVAKPHSLPPLFSKSPPQPKNNTDTLSQKLALSRVR